MEVRNCKTCGRLFNVLSSERICPDCRKKLDDKFQEVKEFLEQNPNSSVEVVSKETDVSAKQIRQWVREERLVFSENSVEGIECEQCGKMIRTGRFCESCKAAITNNLNSAIDKPKKAPVQKKTHDKDRMRFLSQ